MFSVATVIRLAASVILGLNFISGAKTILAIRQELLSRGQT
jgi:hypothetical protein